MTESQSQLYSENLATQDDPDVLRIMISTDNHLVRCHMRCLCRGERLTTVCLMTLASPPFNIQLRNCVLKELYMVWIPWQSKVESNVCITFRYHRAIHLNGEECGLMWKACAKRV